MKHALIAAGVCGLLLAGCGEGAVAAAAVVADAAPASWAADIAEIRRIAALIPGERALRINVEKFAESRRTKNFAVKGAAAEPSVQARTAYQVVYPDGQIMIDSGMNQEIHRYFGRGTEEPYFPEAAERVQRGLQAARLILLTHEHGDHVGGVVDSPLAAQLAPKTLLTLEQLRTLQSAPQVPQIRLTDVAARRYLLMDYERYLPVAPGVVLIKSPGHTPGSQMIYIVLQSGAEYLFAGDVAWHMDGIRQQALKDAPWLTEDSGNLLVQLAWLNALLRNASALHIVVSHDEDQRLADVASRLLGGRFE